MCHSVFHLCYSDGQNLNILLGEVMLSVIKLSVVILSAVVAKFVPTFVRRYFYKKCILYNKLVRLLLTEACRPYLNLARKGNLAYPSGALLEIKTFLLVIYNLVQ
jgi:hypothetical protein